MLSDIEHTARAIDLDAVHEIAALMHQKTQIHFFAKGLTSIVFEYASRHLLSLSRHVTLYQDTHIAYIQAEQLTQNDIVLSCFTKRRNRAGRPCSPDCPGAQCKNRSFHRQSDLQIGKAGGLSFSFGQ